MNVFSIILIVLLAVWFVWALVRMFRDRGRCCGDCSACRSKGCCKAGGCPH